MWELDYKESWVLKNWCFWTVVLEKTLESPLDCRIKPVNSKGISPEYSLEGLMLKPNLQYFGHLMWRADSLEKTLMLGKREGRRRRERQRIRWLDGITDLMGMSLSKLGEIDSEGQGSLARCSPWCCKESDRTEWLYCLRKSHVHFFFVCFNFKFCFSNSQTFIHFNLFTLEAWNIFLLT